MSKADTVFNMLTILCIQKQRVSVEVQAAASPKAISLFSRWGYISKVELPPIDTQGRRGGHTPLCRVGLILENEQDGSTSEHIFQVYGGACVRSYFEGFILFLDDDPDLTTELVIHHAASLEEHA